MRFLLWLFWLMLLIPVCNADNGYYSFFSDNVLRIDYLAGGTNVETEIFVHQMKKEPYYAGSRVNLVDEDNYGNFRYRIFDLQTGKLIFSKGFCPLFHEWLTTAEAEKTRKSFYQVAILPFPKSKIRFTIEMRTWEGDFHQLLSMEIDPKHYFITNEKLPSYEYVQVLKNGEPSKKVDVVFLPEGYTESEMDKFVADVDRLVNLLFTVSPFDRHKTDFNIYAVKVPSEEPGTDVPGEHIYRNTAFNSTFYTFDTSRYLTTSDMKGVHDAASVVPYDHVYVLVNSNRYGGGGFYNFLTISTVGNKLTPQVFVHEFGHSFAGLADEYYTSDVAYNDFYNLETEPWEPNITTMVDFDSKWKSMIDPLTPVPTPREKKFENVTGVFEGGGYLAKGIYSPMMDCRMKSNETSRFCPACSAAIEKTIEQHCK